VTPAKVIDFEIIDGLGRIEEDVVEELALRMDGADKEDIWACLRRDDGVQGNAVKVAYMLLRDKRRLGRDCEHLRFSFQCVSSYPRIQWRRTKSRNVTRNWPPWT
jgi:hypothetical protein